MSTCQTISATELKQWYDNHEVIIIDVRGHWKYKQEHIPGARSLPIEEFAEWPPEPYEALPVVFHCQIGYCTNQNLNKFSQLGLEKCYVLEGGLNAWKAIDGKTRINEKAMRPIAQRIQIVMGGVTLAAAILTYLVSPYFNWLTAIAGAGLVFSGFTQSRLLTRILQSLPSSENRV